jgi:hypothetical protein
VYSSPLVRAETSPRPQSVNLRAQQTRERYSVGRRGEVPVASMTWPASRQQARRVMVLQDMQPRANPQKPTQERAVVDDPDAVHSLCGTHSHLCSMLIHCEEERHCKDAHTRHRRRDQPDGMAILASLRSWIWVIISSKVAPSKTVSLSESPLFETRHWGVKV